jgi:CpXC protein
MSLFQVETVTCPHCGTSKSADVFYSVNADRRPDLREATLERSFQVETCGKCGEDFRIDPEFNYLDTARGQWISVHPLDRLGQWEEIVPADQATFDESYGPGATEGAREIGEGLKIRITFGWSAFREKLVTADFGLDDVELELLKVALLRRQDNAPISDTVELRLVDVVDDELVLCWLDAAADSVVETMLVPMAAYDEIAADTSGWADLRTEVSQTPFVDMQRLMI